MSKNKSKDQKNDPFSLPSVDGEFEKLAESFRKRYSLKPGQDFKVVFKKLNTDKKS